MSTRVRGVAVLVAAAAVMSLAACGSSSGGSGGTTSGSTSTPASAGAPSGAAASGAGSSSAPAAAAPKPLSIAVDAKGDPSGLPATVAAGTYAITATSAARSPYSVVIARLAPGYTVSALFGDVAAGVEADKPDRSAVARLYAKATFVGGPSGAGTQHAIVFLPQGNYVYVNSDVQGRPTPHTLTVGAGATAPQLPTTAASVAGEGDMAGMFTFAVTGSLGDKGMITFRDRSQDNAHFLIVEKVKPGKTAKACEAYQGDPSAAASPCTLLLQSSILSAAGAEVTDYAGQGPGTYLLACFMPDPKTGKVHAEEGMIKQVQVA